MGRTTVQRDCAACDHTSKALRYDTRSQGISLFYLHTPRTSANGMNYTCLCVVDFLLVLIELFSLGVTAGALRANIGLKSAISLQGGRFDPEF